MAGDQNLRRDPAIERWAEMRDNLGSKFRWNQRNIRLVLIYVVAVPLGVWTLSNFTTYRFNMLGSRAGQPLYVKPAETEQQQ